MFTVSIVVPACSDVCLVLLQMCFEKTHKQFHILHLVAQVVGEGGFTNLAKIWEWHRLKPFVPSRHTQTFRVSLCFTFHSMLGGLPELLFRHLSFETKVVLSIVFWDAAPEGCLKRKWYFLEVFWFAAPEGCWKDFTRPDGFMIKFPFSAIASKTLVMHFD